MSGGSFDYVEYKLQENPIGEGMYALDAMVADLQYKYGKSADVPEREYIAAVLADLREKLTALRHQAEELVRPCIPLVHAVEWMCSGDWGEEGVLNEVRIHRGEKD